jgi:Fibronectin type III domain
MTNNPRIERFVIPFVKHRRGELPKSLSYQRSYYDLVQGNQMRKRMGIVASIAVIAILLLSGLMVIGTDKVAADQAISVPDAPTGLKATPGANQMSLSWNAPVSNGGAAIDYYIIYREIDENCDGSLSTSLNETVWRVGVELPAGQTDFNVTINDLKFLVNGLCLFTYNFTVAAHNMAGTGPKSEYVLTNTYTVPNAEYLAITPGDGKGFLEWGFYGEWGVDGGSPIQYCTIYQDGIKIYQTPNGNVDNHTVTGLINGHAYNFSVVAHNAAGDGPNNSVSMVPMLVPDAPTGLIATAGNGSVTLNWTAPDNSNETFFDGEQFVDGYNLYIDGVERLVVLNSENNGTPPDRQGVVIDTPRGRHISVTITRWDYPLLTNGQTYVFAVSAYNKAGEGQKSLNVSVTLGFKNSSVPTDLVAVTGDGRVNLFWSAPDRGAPIDYYVIYQNGTDVQHSVSTETIITGLIDGRSYGFTVAAHSSAGMSGNSSSVQAMPYTFPYPPNQLTAVPGDRQVTLSWTAPGISGGRPIDYYIVYQDGTALPDHPTGPSTVITGLVNGQTYSFKVSAHNLAGSGAWSETVTAAPSAAQTVPDAPSGLVATPGNAQVSMSWKAPTSNGGAAIDYYIVYQNGIDIAHTTLTTKTVSGLINGISYTFKVAAHNSVGLGSQSAPVTCVPLTIPGTPGGLSADPGNGRVSLGWSAPSSNGGAVIDYYIVYRNGTDIAHQTTNGQIVTGLTNGVSYTFTVAAHNAAGNGPQSSGVAATPITAKTAPNVPGMPTGLAATPGSAQVSLSWTAPTSNGGAPIDYYIVYLNGTDVQHPTGTGASVTGLSNGQTYDFSVAAHNSAGAGIQTPSVSATLNPSTAVPGVPTDLVATPGDGQVSLSWAAPSDNGGAIIDYYLVYVNGAARSDHYTTNSTTITGLTNDQPYSFAITAHNSVGEGPKSSALTVSPTTVAKVPGVPMGLSATPGNGLVTLSWATPDDNGGAAIDYYIVYQNGTEVVSTATASDNVTGLANGEPYDFTVAAHNSIGTGNQTPSITATPTSGFAVPGIPTNLTTAPGIGNVTLSWTAPSGGSSIDYYIVYQDGVDVSHTPSTSATITGLNDGENYSFSVAAHNAGGVGARSLAQNISPSPNGASSGGDNMAYLSIVLALLIVAIIAAILVVRRNRKK